MVAVLLGLLGAVAVTIGAPPTGRTFATASGAAQSLISIAVPLVGVMLVGELCRPLRRTELLPAGRRALGMAMLLAVTGILISVAVTVVAPSDAPGGPWQKTGMIVLGSLLVQGMAQLVGLGIGVLIPRRVLAGFATVVLPLGLWALLGAIPSLRPARAWVTPFPSAQRLLSGLMTPIVWAEWLAVVVIWGIGLPALGLLIDRGHRGSGVRRQR